MAKRCSKVFFIFIIISIFFIFTPHLYIGAGFTSNPLLAQERYEDSPFGFQPATGINRLDIYEEAKDIGIKWERRGALPYIFWSLVDPNKTGDESQFQWSGKNEKGKWRYDSMLLSQEAGLHRLYNIDIAPKDAELQGEFVKQGSWLPVNEEAYKAFVKAAVKRYPSIKYWQVGNEPTKNKKKSGFAKYLSITYDAIKEANPEAKVLIGGVPGLNSPSTIEGYKENFDSFYLPLLEDVAKQGKRSFDIFDFHWYGSADGYYKMSKGIKEHIAQRIEELGIPEPEEYWITEMGSYSGDPHPIEFPPGKVQKDWPFQTEKQQAVDLVKRYVYPVSFGIKKVFWAWGIKEGFRRNCGYFDYTGIIYDGCDCVNGEYVCARDDTYDPGPGVKKLAYYTFKKMTEKLEGSDWNNIQTVQESDGIYIYKFTKKDSGKPIWVAWNDNSDTKIVSLDVSSDKLTITEAIPDAENGAQLTKEVSFKTEVKEVSKGSVFVSLGSSPVYIEEGEVPTPVYKVEKAVLSTMPNQKSPSHKERIRQRQPRRDSPAIR
ncbi:MAG: hypothetical protein Q8N76_04060 [Candidatus Omnitrophota bacterium]|nr:hypothetical protein [Candidatus Omnitrophota bacterium]